MTSGELKFRPHASGPSIVVATQFMAANRRGEHKIDTFLPLAKRLGARLELGASLRFARDRHLFFRSPAEI